MTEQPTVSLTIGDSILAFDTRGEILESVETLSDGTPDWDGAGICDHRGGAGPEGFELLHRALTAAEENARLMGFAIVRVSSGSGS